MMTLAILRWVDRIVGIIFVSDFRAGSEMRRSFEEVEFRSAIHASKFLDRDDRKDRRDTIVEWENFPGFLVSERAGIDERRALAKRTMCVATSEKSDDPSHDAESQTEDENFDSQRGGHHEEQNQRGDCS